MIHTGILEQALAAQVILWLIVLTAFFMSGQASLFHPVTVYLLFHGLVFVLRPILVVLFGFDTVWNYMVFSPTPEDMAMSLAVSSVTLVVFCSTCLAFGWCRVGNYSAQRHPFTKMEDASLVLTTLLLAPVIAYSIHVTSAGEATGVHIGGTYVMTGSSGYINDAQLMAGALICAWLVVAGFRWPVLAVSAIYIMYRAYQGWGRWTILLFFLATAMVYAWRRQHRWMPLWSILLVIPAYMLFHALGQHRSWFQDVLSGQTPISQTAQGLPEEEQLKQKYDSQEFANFDYLTYVVAMVPERTGCYSYGVQHLQLFTEPIPRKLWPGKPIGAPVQFFNLNAYGNFLGLTVSMAGDGWMSGGWIGVIITAGIAGLLLGLAHRWFWLKAQHDHILGLFYILGLAMIAQHYRDGNIVSIAKFFFWNWLPLFVWLGCNWVLGPRLVPAESVLLPRDTRLRLLMPENRFPASQSGQN